MRKAPNTDNHSQHRTGHIIRLLLAVAVFLLLAADMGVPSASAQQAPMRFESLHQLGGTVGKIASNEQYAYIVEGPRVVVLDVSDPRTPRAVGRSPELPGLIAYISLAGRYSYVVGSDSGISMTVHVIDLIEPTSPKLIGSLAGISGSPRGVVAHADRLYIAAGFAGLRIFDVSIPSRPVEMSNLRGQQVIGVAVSEDTRFVYTIEAIQNNTLFVFQLQIVDVSNPTFPTRLGAVTIPSRYSPGEFAIGGRNVFVLDTIGNLHVIDISDPNSPIEIGSYTGVYGIKVRVIGTRLYVLNDNAGTDGSSYFHVFDVTAPTRPTLLASFQLSAGGGVAPRVVDFVVVGTKAYFSFGTDLRIVEVGDPTSTMQLGVHTALGGARQIVIADRRAYVVSDFGFRIFDLSNPLQPEMVGSIQLPFGASASRVSIADGRAFITSYSWVFIYDVSDPTRPTQIGSYQVGQTLNGINRWLISGLAIAGNDMYLATTSGLHIVDISNPASPFEVSSVTLMATCYSANCSGGIVIAGNRVFMGMGTLYAFDISDRAHPRELGRGDTTIIDVGEIVVRDRYVFAATAPGLRIFDVADPTRPTELKFAKIGEVSSPAVRDNQLYVTVNHVLQIFDVSNPANPIQLTSEPQFGATGLAPACGYVYTVSETSGLRILQAVPTVVTSLPTPAAGITRHIFPLLVQRTTLNGC